MKLITLLSTLSIILLSALLLTTCSKDEVTPQSGEYELIRYGTSFGFCMGYCIHTLELTDSKLEYKKGGWDSQDIVEDVYMSATNQAEDWNSLIATIDFDAFRQLDTIIGCPDCADGGTEWIEIKKKDQTYRVNFEYFNEPKMVAELVSILRTYMATFDVEKSEDIKFEERTFVNQAATIKNVVCSRGCYQHLIEVVTENDTSYYYDQYLKAAFQVDQLAVSFNGVLLADSTMIYKPAANDVPIPDFKVRNIQIYGITGNNE